MQASETQVRLVESISQAQRAQPHGACEKLPVPVDKSIKVLIYHTLA
jgi:hypothetical protein